MDLAYLYLLVYQPADSRAPGEHPVLGITLLIFCARLANPDFDLSRRAVAIALDVGGYVRRWRLHTLSKL